jgi:hypothetical protein
MISVGIPDKIQPVLLPVFPKGSEENKKRTIKLSRWAQMQENIVKVPNLYAID